LIENAVLVGVGIKGRKQLWNLDDSLDELGKLTTTAGAKVSALMKQMLPKPSPQYLGSGKLDELKTFQAKHDINLIITDDELSPTQQFNLQKSLGDGIKVIDRTALILDIFSQRAQTKEGRLQVQLAQHEYLLPRLAGQWTHLERLGGGIGTRGPGETQIETDRRLIRSRIQKIKSQLELVRKHRERYRSTRKMRDVPVVSLVGYTNAGKSTLLNALTGSNVISENKLFSTLDPITRRIRLPSGNNILLTDTVGFINKLPHKIIAAFRATLEELQDSSIILEVIDLSDKNSLQQSKVVNSTLKEVGCSFIPKITVFNKIDRIPNNNEISIKLEEFKNDLEEHELNSMVLVSASEKIGLGDILDSIETTLVMKP